MVYIIPNQNPPSGNPAEWAGLTPLLDWNMANAVTSGSSPIKITSVPDASGNGRNLTGASGFEPNYVATGYFNNKPVADFPVVGDGLSGHELHFTFGSLGRTTGQDFTSIIIAQTARTGTNAYCMTTGNEHFAQYANSTSELHAWASASFAEINSALSFNQATLLCQTKSSTIQTLYVNSTTENLHTSTTGVDLTGGGMLGVYAAINQETYEFGGQVARVLLFDKVLSSGERTTVFTALASKYGITLV